MFNYYKKLYVYATSNSLLVQGMKAFRTSCHTKGAIMSLLDIFAFVLDIVFFRNKSRNKYSLDDKKSNQYIVDKKKETKKNVK
jgi:hypothetical protein